MQWKYFGLLCLLAGVPAAAGAYQLRGGAVEQLYGLARDPEGAGLLMDNSSRLAGGPGTIPGRGSHYFPEYPPKIYVPSTAEPIVVPVHEPDRALKSPPKKSGNGVFEILKTGFLMFWGTMFMAGLGAAFGPVGAIVGALAGATGAWLLKDRI